MPQANQTPYAALLAEVYRLAKVQTDLASGARAALVPIDKNKPLTRPAVEAIRRRLQAFRNAVEAQFRTPNSTIDAFNALDDAAAAAHPKETKAMEARLTQASGELTRWQREARALHKAYDAARQQAFGNRLRAGRVTHRITRHVGLPASCVAKPCIVSAASGFVCASVADTGPSLLRWARPLGFVPSGLTRFSLSCLFQLTGVAAESVLAFPSNVAGRGVEFASQTGKNRRAEAQKVTQVTQKRETPQRRKPLRR